MTGRGGAAPAGRHQGADEGDPEADEDVPALEVRNRQRALADVEDDDPGEPDQHEAEHHRLEPDGVRRLTGALVCAQLDSDTGSGHAEESSKAGPSLLR